MSPTRGWDPEDLPQPDDADPDLDPGQTVVALSQQVRELEDLIRMVAWGVQHELAAPKQQLIDLAARVAALEVQPDPPAPAEEPPPQAWADRATAEDWRKLALWVDWLTATYDVLTSRAVLECWPAHRGVAEELAALRAAWVSAALAAADDEPTELLLAWHDRWLHPTLARFREMYQQKACPDHHAQPRTANPTSPDHLAAAMVTAAEGTSGPGGAAGVPASDPSTGELR